MHDVHNRDVMIERACLLDPSAHLFIRNNLASLDRRHAVSDFLLEPFIVGDEVIEAVYALTESASAQGFPLLGFGEELPNNMIDAPTSGRFFIKSQVTRQEERRHADH
jgi:hypothetical protein